MSDLDAPAPSALKACIPCGASQPAESATCALCGEASWAADVEPAPESDPEPDGAHPPARPRGRRRAR